MKMIEYIAILLVTHIFNFNNNIFNLFELRAKNVYDINMD